jgi:hypothetical protein
VHHDTQEAQVAVHVYGLRKSYGSLVAGWLVASVEDAE